MQRENLLITTRAHTRPAHLGMTTSKVGSCTKVPAGAGGNQHRTDQETDTVRRDEREGRSQMTHQHNSRQHCRNRVHFCTTSEHCSLTRGYYRVRLVGYNHLTAPRTVVGVPESERQKLTFVHSFVRIRFDKRREKFHRETGCCWTWTFGKGSVGAKFICSQK